MLLRALKPAEPWGGAEAGHQGVAAGRLSSAWKQWSGARQASGLWQSVAMCGNTRQLEALLHPGPGQGRI